MDDELPAKSGPSGFQIALIVVAALTIGMTLLFRAMAARAVSPLMGRQFPNIEAQGWINGPAPTPEDLKGQVIVVDAWAYWCEPCRLAASEVLNLYNKYKDRGVQFIGLTSEGDDSRSIELSHKFVTSLKIPWPNGYGATKILTELDVTAIPQLFIIDRQNRIIFHEIGFDQSSLQSMESVLESALKSQ